MSSITTTSNPVELNADRGEFKAPGLVVALGAACLGCLFFTARSFSEKIFADMQGVTTDTTMLLLLAVVLGFIAEVLGASYLFHRRKHGTQKKLGAVLVIAVMVMILLPIQFAVLSMWIDRTAV